jgi:SAM-dependent methyltransferase
MALPFKDNSFDVISTYLMIEFIPDVEKALLEMIRVLKTNGRIIIMAPNLCSPFVPLYDFIKLLRGKGGRPVWARNKKEALRWLWGNLFISLRKRFLNNYSFLYRTPDLSCREVVGRDSDSVYLVNQVDLRNFFRKQGFRIIRSGENSDIMQRFFPSFAVTVDTVVLKK